jgi:hypothetical protein
MSDSDFDFDDCVRHKSKEPSEAEKALLKKELLELSKKHKQEEAEHKASFRTDKVKKRVKSLSKIIDDDDWGTDYSEYMSYSDEEYSASEFLSDLLAAGAVKKNILIALMDKKGCFDEIDASVREVEGDAHEEWWYGGQAEAEGF